MTADELAEIIFCCYRLPAHLLVRVPFQPFVIWWTYYATEQRWFPQRAREAEPIVRF